jgi:hypothetical protein
MKKTNKKTESPAPEKKFLELAGEAMSVLGKEIIEGKDKLVAISVETFEDVKKVVKKKFAKKKAAVKKKAKKAAKKVVAKKKAVPVKKAAKKTAKKGTSKKK